MVYHRDCKYFKGELPCKIHKLHGSHCEDCKYYIPQNGRVLIIKLGAIGDVIRTTPLISKIRSEFPDKAIWWLTYSPDILPDTIDKILPFNLESILIIQATKFDLIINLDKDTQAGAVLESTEASKKIGFTIKDGRPAPLNKEAEHKFITGLFDDVNQANRKSYLEEIFEICGWKFSGEEYQLPVDESIKWDIPNNAKKIIGLNTGCGDRWVTRLWADENWIELIKQLSQAGYYPMLLGGSQEHEKNLMLSQKTGAYYPGHFTLKEFISLVNQCDLVISAVTMGMHIAMGLKKTLILMNNIFNPYEFELYGRGEIIQPDKPCTCYFSPKCKNEEYFCMDHLHPQAMMKLIDKYVKP